MVYLSLPLQGGFHIFIFPHMLGTQVVEREELIHTVYVLLVLICMATYFFLFFYIGSCMYVQVLYSCPSDMRLALFSCLPI